MNENLFANLSVSAILLFTVTLIMLHFDRWVRERDYERWRNAFASAFLEWSESCEWMGYREIPHEMYEDLVARLQAVRAAPASGGDDA